MLPPARILMITLWCYLALNKDFVVALSAIVAPSVLAMEFKQFPLLPCSLPGFAHLVGTVFSVLGNRVLAFPGAHVNS